MEAPRSLACGRARPDQAAYVDRVRGLTPRDVLADLFGSDDFPPEILLDPAHAADVVIQRLLDAGFEIVPPRSV